MLNIYFDFSNFKEVTRNVEITTKTELVARGTRGIYDKLSTGKVYHALNGLEGGMLEDKPYITVVANDGKIFSCHACRFWVKK